MTENQNKSKSSKEDETAFFFVIFFFKYILNNIYKQFSIHNIISS